MKPIKYTLLCIAFIWAYISANGQNVAQLDQIGTKPIAFVQNKGQVIDQYGCSRPDVDFALKAANGLSVFVGTGRLTYQFYKNDRNCSEQSDMYRLDVVLPGANPFAELVTEQQLPYYERYHTAVVNTASKPALSFGKVIYKNIWPKIDWVLYSKNGHLEYDFVIHPGGDPAQVKIEYKGSTELRTTNGMVVAKTPLGTITERNLNCYVEETRQSVPARFAVNERFVGFDLKPQQGTLVIDPTLEWSTYFGGPVNESSGRVTAKDGNLYMLGGSSSASGIATTGSYQSAYGGGLSDIYICKFTSGGNLLWATYYGGSGSEVSISHIVPDDSGNVYISGNTNSTDSIATVGTYQSALGGSDDGFLAKFSAAGALLWSTYFGGSNGETGSDVVVDGGGSVYICGSTSSTSGIATPGAFHTSYAGGVSDGYLARFTTGGALVWATYFGGSNNDPAYRVICDRMTNVYISGGTNSTDNIASPWAHNTVLGAVGYDAYLARFDNSGGLIWSTYYGGEKHEAGSYGMVCDTVGNVYISGQTSSSDSIATPGAHQEVLDGINDTYLAKFNPEGGLVWGTYYGGGSQDFSSDLFCTKGGKVYSAGNTGSVDSIATPDAYKAYLSAGSDAYLAIFSTEGLLKYGTYFGGPMGDFAYGVTADDSGNVYLAGQTRSADSIATPGAYQTIYGGGGYDVFLAKFKTDSIFAPADTNLSISQQTLDMDAHLFPNPVKDRVNVSCNCNAIESIAIYDLAGRLVDQRFFQSATGVVALEMSDLPQGLYLYKLQGEHGVTKNGKFLKQ